ncbi:MAG TPA: efflux RND transporter periplasmic adaptor subunit [Pseudacidobacterium sp.]|nr:efflux RND transporter periplasmic adaptor subunit [Pseudacidobacterium sp.]
MNARNKILVLMGILLIVAVGWYYFSTQRTSDLQLIGTVDANEVVVSSRIPGRIHQLFVDEGDDVKAGQLIATIESEDLAAAKKAAAATALGQRYRLAGAADSARQTLQGTRDQVASAEAQVNAAKAALAQAQANAARSQTDLQRYTALVQKDVISKQQYDQALAAAKADQAQVESAKANVTAAEAALKVAQANTIQAEVAEKTVAATRSEMQNAQALLNQAQTQLDYAQVVTPISGKVNVRAARQGEVVSAGTPIVTITDLTQTWVYAPLPETEADAVQVGDMLRVVMPSGATVQGKVIEKSAEGDFATQRDVSRRKRDIKTIRLKLLIENPGMRYVPGMTAEVYIPKDKLVHK